MSYEPICSTVTFFRRQLKNELRSMYLEILATASLEKRETGLGTSPRVVRSIPRGAGLFPRFPG